MITVLRRALFAFLLCLASAPIFALAPAPQAAAPSSMLGSVIVSGGAIMNGDHFNDAVLPAMREHYAGCRRIALILHASHPADFQRMELRLQKAFAHVNGAKAESLHPLDAAGQLALLSQADGIFVGGGETFVLLAQLHRTGQLELIRARVKAGVPYMGASAGANVAGILIGTTNDFPVADIPTRNSLGIFPAVINPHHPVPQEKADFASRANKIKVYLDFNPTESVLGLANAAMVRLHGGKISVVGGTAWLYRKGNTRPLVVGDELPELLVPAAKP